MPYPPLRLIALVLAAAAAFAVAGCAFSRSEDKSTIVFTHDAHAPASPLHRVSLVMVAGRFAGKDGKDGKLLMTGLADMGNAHVATLFPALVRRLPQAMLAAGVQVADARTDAPGVVPDAVLTLKPLSSATDQFGFHLSIKAELRDARQAVLWSGTVDAQPNQTTPERVALRDFGDAMADDIARTLIERWRSDGVLPPPVSAVASR